ncbi:MAG: hypothetical protein OXC71_03910 [Chloroflexi bacterium]|nr:hypothetical protein [Chloroflexota bacterium]
MDGSDSPNQAAFRAEVRTPLDEQLIREGATARRGAAAGLPRSP